MDMIFERILKRLLRESNASADALAVLSFDKDGSKVAILYDPIDLLENLDDVLDPDQRARLFEDYGVADIIKGAVSIRPVSKRMGQCRGAWQIAYIAGPGWGHILYPIAQAMSPNGLLTPDRKDVSDDASRAWEKSLKLNRPRLPFDDMEHQHDIEGNEYHTDDPKDDCVVHLGRNHLNWAYEPLGDEAQLLSGLISNHVSTMSKMPADAARAVRDILEEEGDIFVDKYLPPADV